MAKLIQSGGYAGAMLWGINPSDKWTPKAATWCPAVANMLSNTLKPKDRFEHLYAAPHKYTKADPKTGWLPKVAAHLPLPLSLTLILPLSLTLTLTLSLSLILTTPQP